MTTGQTILVINCGSSSVKFALFANKPTLPCLLNGAIERIGLAAPVALSSRADPPAARLAALALASLMHNRSTKSAPIEARPGESSLHCAPQPEHACCPVPG